MDIAEQKLINLSQGETFPSELKLLRSGRVITRNSRIAKYSPFIGPAGILCSTGRISRLVDSDFDNKHPIIPDARHAIVRLLVKHLHVRNIHQGLDYMRAVVNLKYVVLNLRWLLRKIENTCVANRKRKAQTVTHIMAELPIERLGYRQPPFSNTGVDYFGQFLVPIRRSTEKRLAFLFTCLTTRAVHIEVVPSLDTSSCVKGVERFLHVAVTEEVLRATLCLDEQSLNARLITAVKTNPLDLEALTLNHFILGQYTENFLSLSFEENFDHKKRGSPERNHTLTQYGHGGCVNTFLPSIGGQSGTTSQTLS